MNKLLYESKIELNESIASETKENIIEFLIGEGYGTYAKRLQTYKFVIAHMYHGVFIEVAAMFPDYNEIVINPSMVDATKMVVAGNKTDKRRPEVKMMEQLSVLIRHELLHFLLVHTHRFEEYLKSIDPNWETELKKYTVQDLSNQAMDYEISLEGYDEHDKEVVRLMTLNNVVVGGLIAEDDHPEWGKKTMEEMYQILKDEHDRQMAEKQKYAEAYAKAMAALKDLTDDQLKEVLDQVFWGKSPVNPNTLQKIFD